MLSILNLFISMILFQHVQCRMEATAQIMLANTSTSIGMLTLVQETAGASVMIQGTLTGLVANQSLGFHVHETGVDEKVPNCNSAGPHFNPYNVSHGPPSHNKTNRHVGDLGNITTDIDGKAMISISDNIISLHSSTESIMMRSFVIHATFDDGGFGNGTSNTTGNAGIRVACGLIKMKSTASQVKIIGSLLLSAIAFIFIS